MNNLTSFTAYFNSIKQTLQSHSINYIELNNKIKELESSMKSVAAATPDISNISTLINDTVSQAVEKYKPDLSSFITLINEAVEAAVAVAVTKAIASLNIKDSIKDMINDALSKLDFKSMIDKYIEEKLSLVIATPIEEVNILELSQVTVESADVEAEADTEASPDGSQQGSQEDEINLSVKKEKKTTKKRTPKVKS